MGTTAMLVRFACMLPMGGYSLCTSFCQSQIWNLRRSDDKHVQSVPSSAKTASNVELHTKTNTYQYMVSMREWSFSPIVVQFVEIDTRTDNGMPCIAVNYVLS